jgi:transcription factor TFIIIB component B''
MSAQTTASLANALNRAAHRQTQTRTAADLATEIIGEATGAEVSDKPKRKRRRKTPDDAEEHVIDPAETKMGDLTRDTGLGKKSGIELALENIDWKAVKQQQKEKAEEIRKQEEAERAEKRSTKPKKKRTRKEAQAEAVVPELAVVNGVIVSLAESREIDIRKDAEAEAARQDATVLTIDKLTTRTNQNTVGKQKGLSGKPLHWSLEMDERFYKGIRMFGADMLMVSSLFPGMDRRHVKHKFVREERANAQKLREALFNPTPIDAETYQEETGMELGDPRKLDAELKAMEADLRKRFEDQTAEQQAGAHPVEVDDADIPVQSREQGSAEPQAGATRAQSGRARENRFNAVADDIVNEAMGLRPTGVKKSKKKAAPLRKKKDGSAPAPRKGSKAAKQAQALLQLGGTVEEIGTVDEVPR